MARRVRDWMHREVPTVREGTSLAEIGERTGRRLEELTVADVMAREPVTVGPADAARLLVEHRFHRVPVVESGRLVGILTSLALARSIAEGS